ncbi:MAG: hypothetical protein JSS39_04765 [Nitrospira sp.]|nr:hypothetical protein [Nitrospira sp.]
MLAAGIPTTRCPKCKAERPDEAIECGRCGIIFAKYRPGAEQARLASSSASVARSLWLLTANRWLIESDRTADSMTFYGRAAVLTAMIWWGGSSS